MYFGYWGLTEMPFENTPDPKFLYHSPQHEEGLSRLAYVLENNKGAAMLTGIFGCGKTVLVRTLVSNLSSRNYQVAFISNPQLTVIELLRSIARNLGAENLPNRLSDMSCDYFLEVIEKILVNNYKDSKGTLVIIDEAHVITDMAVLEELRLLLNFQAENRFLLTLFLMGQPELHDRIVMVKQLLQRIALSHHLGPLNEEETAHYIAYRLSVAGATRKIFNESSLALVYKISGGIPRRINHICDLCLFIGATAKVEIINEEIVENAASSFEVA